ncbi:MAG: hypothetical protein WKH64_16835 [Chloroflexia bacterium]
MVQETPLDPAVREKVAQHVLKWTLEDYYMGGDRPRIEVVKDLTLEDLLSMGQCPSPDANPDDPLRPGGGERRPGPERRRAWVRESHSRTRHVPLYCAYRRCEVGHADVERADGVAPRRQLPHDPGRSEPSRGRTARLASWYQAR